MHLSTFVFQVSGCLNVSMKGIFTSHIVCDFDCWSVFTYCHIRSWNGPHEQSLCLISSCMVSSLKYVSLWWNIVCYCYSKQHILAQKGPCQVNVNMGCISHVSKHLCHCHHHAIFLWHILCSFDNSLHYIITFTLLIIMLVGVDFHCKLVPCVLITIQVVIEILVLLHSVSH